MKEKLEVIRDITPEMECKLRSKLVPWVAKISIRHKNICLGLFKNKEDAINARKKAEADSGLHISAQAAINTIKEI